MSKDLRPLDPCHPARARKLLREGKAAVYRRFPFTLVLRERLAAESTVREHRLKLDPGAKKTGIALESDGRIVWAAELEHRGFQIRDRLTARRALRRSRRSRKTRYRPPRFANRRRPEEWLPPSLGSRVANIDTWMRRLMRFCPVTALSQELVRFDLHKMQNPEVSGIGYQQGTLYGYEVREFLLEKWQRTCVYCGAKDVPLEVEHIVPRSRGGSDRISNLTLSCVSCNRLKGTHPVEEFLQGRPEVLRRLRATASKPLADAAAVNTTRWALYRRLQATGLPVEIGSGGVTKYNRIRLGLPKTHWRDACAVGSSTPEDLEVRVRRPLMIHATGHGVRQRCITDRYGFPKSHAERAKRFQGFRTGDLVRAVVPNGKYRGTHEGRVAIRHRPSFRLSNAAAKFDVHPKYLRRVHHADGYSYG